MAIDYTLIDPSSYSTKEFRTIVNNLARNLNRRIANIEKNYGTSPAIMESNVRMGMKKDATLRFSVKGMDRRQLEGLFQEMLTFAGNPYSTVKGMKQFRKNADRFNAQYKKRKSRKKKKQYTDMEINLMIGQLWTLVKEKQLDSNTVYYLAQSRDGELIEEVLNMSFEQRHEAKILRRAMQAAKAAQRRKKKV